MRQHQFYTFGGCWIILYQQYTHFKFSASISAGESLLELTASMTVLRLVV
jgi:hypothetical protein